MLDKFRPEPRIAGVLMAREGQWLSASEIQGILWREQRFISSARQVSAKIKAMGYTPELLVGGAIESIQTSGHEGCRYRWVKAGVMTPILLYPSAVRPPSPPASYRPP